MFDYLTWLHSLHCSQSVYYLCGMHLNHNMAVKDFYRVEMMRPCALWESRMRFGKNEYQITKIDSPKMLHSIVVIII